MVELRTDLALGTTGLEFSGRVQVPALGFFVGGDFGHEFTVAG